MTIHSSVSVLKVSLKLWQWMLLVSILAFSLYANTLTHQYALDDGLVIDENYTTLGLEGIPALLSNDTYQFFYDKKGSSGELSGGRYRPLSVITLAIEYAFFEKTPWISHLVNVLLFALCGALLFKLLAQYIAPDKPIIILLTTLLFIVHPIHTEVVANIKSRDEIMSWIFLILTLNYTFKWVKEANKKALIGVCITFFLALLSKENGVTYIAIVPIALLCFASLNLKNAIKHALPIFAVAALFLIIRFSILGTGTEHSTSLLNDPFLLIQDDSNLLLGTKFHILLKYLGLQLWPAVLSYDYGFNTIPYKALFSISALASIMLHLGGGIWALFYLKKQPIPAFAILFYLATISIISNLVVPLGATMGERLVFISSFGICLLVAWVLDYVLSHKMKQPAIAILIGVPILFLASYKTTTRNQVWKNNDTLFLTDIATVPNSIKANNAAANQLVVQVSDKQQEGIDLIGEDSTKLTRALDYTRQSIALFPKELISGSQPDLYIMNSFDKEMYIQYTLNKQSKAEEALERARKVAPQHTIVKKYDELFATVYDNKAQQAELNNEPTKAISYLKKAAQYSHMPIRKKQASFYHKFGNSAGNKKEYSKAIEYLEKAIRLDSTTAEIWYDAGGANYSNGNYRRAFILWENTLRLDSNHTNAKRGYTALKQQNGWR